MKLNLNEILKNPNKYKIDTEKETFRRNNKL